jgi:5'-AMP-activated protein kinase regulatory gamma subunit
LGIITLSDVLRYVIGEVGIGEGQEPEEEKKPTEEAGPTKEASS